VNGKTNGFKRNMKETAEVLRTTGNLQQLFGMDEKHG
jgi:hypothetical protein